MKSLYSRLAHFLFSYPTEDPADGQSIEDEPLAPAEDQAIEDEALMHTDDQTAEEEAHVPLGDFEDLENHQGDLADNTNVLAEADTEAAARLQQKAEEAMATLQAFVSRVDNTLFPDYTDLQMRPFVPLEQLLDFNTFRNILGLFLFGLIDKVQKQLIIAHVGRDSYHLRLLAILLFTFHELGVRFDPLRQTLKDLDIEAWKKHELSSVEDQYSALLRSSTLTRSGSLTASELVTRLCSNWHKFEPVILIEGEHKRIEIHERLPFVSLNSNKSWSGSSSHVHQAEVAEGYWEIREERTYRLSQTFKMAVKVFRNRHKFDHELSIHAKIAKMVLRGSLKIVPPLGSLAGDTASYMFFNWAGLGDLHSFFEQDEHRKEPAKRIQMVWAMYRLLETLMFMEDAEIDSERGESSRDEEEGNRMRLRHGDFKPRNIFVFLNKRRVLDFRLGDFGEAEASMFQNGTPVSNETMRPLIRRFTYGAPQPDLQRNDIWAWACVTLEMLIYNWHGGADAIKSFRSGKVAESTCDTFYSDSDLKSRVETQLQYLESIQLELLKEQILVRSLAECLRTKIFNPMIKGRPVETSAVKEKFAEILNMHMSNNDRSQSKELPPGGKTCKFSADGQIIYTQHPEGYNAYSIISADKANSEMFLSEPPSFDAPARTEWRHWLDFTSAGHLGVVSKDKVGRYIHVELHAPSSADVSFSLQQPFQRTTKMATSPDVDSRFIAAATQDSVSIFWDPSLKWKSAETGIAYGAGFNAKVAAGCEILGLKFSPDSKHLVMFSCTERRTPRFTIYSVPHQGGVIDWSESKVIDFPNLLKPNLKFWAPLPLPEGDVGVIAIFNKKDVCKAASNSDISWTTSASSNLESLVVTEDGQHAITLGNEGNKLKLSLLKLHSTLPGRLQPLQTNIKPGKKFIWSPKTHQATLRESFKLTVASCDGRFLMVDEIDLKSLLSRNRR